MSFSKVSLRTRVIEGGSDALGNDHSKCRLKKARVTLRRCEMRVTQLVIILFPMLIIGMKSVIGRWQVPCSLQSGWLVFK